MASTFQDLDVEGNLSCNDCSVRGGLWVAGNSLMIVANQGVAIPNNPHQGLNFIGDGVVAEDARSGIASVTIPGIVFQQAGMIPLVGTPSRPARAVQEKRTK